MFGLCIVRFDKILIIVSKAKNLVAGFTVVFARKRDQSSLWIRLHAKI